MLLITLLSSISGVSVVWSEAGTAVGQPVSVLQTDSHRLLLIGRVVVGAEYRMEWARDQAVFSGMALMQSVGFLTEPVPRRVLALGLGSGTAPAFLRARGIATDVVEIEPKVIAAAEAHFLFGEHRAPGSTLCADAVAYMRNATGGAPASASLLYDAILSDLFDGDNPMGLLDADQLRALKAGWLQPETGVLALNIVAFRTGPHARLARAVAATLRSVFRHVVVYADHDPRAADGDSSLPGNLLFLASDTAVAKRLATPPDEGDPPESSFYLHAHFKGWAPPELAAAADGEEGDVLAAGSGGGGEPPAWLREAAAAVRAAVPEMQRDALPAEGWQVVERLVAERSGGTATAKEELR